MAAVSVHTLYESNQALSVGDLSTRSHFLAQCGKYYEAVHSDQKSYLPDDAFLKKAEEIIRDEILQDHPGSLIRLKPLATRYLAQVLSTRFLFSLSNPPTSAEASRQIDQLVAANNAFITQFIAEFKIVGKHTALGTQFNQPRALKVYYSTVFDYLIANPAQVPVAQTLFEDADAKLFDLIPYCVVLTLLKHQPSADQLPELFAPSGLELAHLRESYQKLPLTDREALSAMAFTAEEDKSLTPAGQEFYRRVFELIYEKREHEKLVFAAINQALFQFVSSDIQLAQLLQSHPKIRDVPMPVQIEDLVSFFKELSEPEYGEMKKGFSFLPPFSERADLSSAAIQERTYAYRLLGIVMLGRALAQ
jgi:hypothetical protein